jgi:hypothetical protein
LWLEENGNLGRREYTPAADGLGLFSVEVKWAVGTVEMIVDVFVTLHFIEWRFVNDHAADMIRSFCTQPQNDGAAEGMPNDMSRCDLQRLNQSDKVGCMLLNASSTGRSFALAVFPPVVGDHLIGLGE